MNPCQTIHETIIRDIVDVMTDIKDTDEIQFALGKEKSFKSISAASANLTCVFPVIGDSSLDISTLQMGVKAYERKAVSMLQMLLSAFAISDAKNASDYVSRFHTNLKIDNDITIDKFIDMVDVIANKLDESSGIVLDRDMYEAAKADLNNLNFYLESMDSINDTPISNYKILPRSIGSTKVVCEAPAIKQGSLRNLVDLSQTLKNNSDTVGKQVLDSDIKKSNELMPTLMNVSFLTPTSDGSDFVKLDSAVIGVKAKLYPASPTDIIERIASKNKDNNGLNMFIRATTREISFWKDFVFAIDRAKMDAISSSKRGSSSPVWKLLERRALKSRIRRNFRMTNDATAITSLMMSQNTAEALKIQHNINIESVSTARSTMESFNLMSISVMDESLEVAKFIYDTGDDIYENLSFNALERESSDNTYKRVVNLMTKMR